MIRLKPKLAKLPNKSRMMLELVRGMADFTDDIERALKQPTATWSSPVAFGRKVDASDSRIETKVETGDRRYLWTSEGTKKHVIRARAGGVLRFPQVSRPKTRPGQLTAGSGYKAGATVTAQKVKHPGTKARNFPQAAAKVLRPVFKFRIQDAVHRAVEASGHKFP